MGALSTLTKSLSHHCIKTSKSHLQKPLVNLSNFENFNYATNSQYHHYQSRRTLILDSVSSESVKLNRLSDTDSGIVEVNLNRPAARNAIGKDFLRGLKDSFEVISKDSTANVVLITSSVPKVFCAGADLKERRMMSASEIHFFVNSLRSTFSFLETLGIPTIAVIEGAALGGGLEMALACDLRICGEDAVLGLPETGLAIIPGAGGTQRLPRLVGNSVAKELIFTGRKIGGREAMSIGLVNYCVPASEAQLKALEVAREINQKGPIAIRMAKRPLVRDLRLIRHQLLSWKKSATYRPYIQMTDWRAWLHLLRSGNLSILAHRKK